MIAKMDFAPRIVKPPTTGVFTSEPAQLETVEGVVATANEWIRNNAIDVLNVETVLASEHPDAGAQTFVAQGGAGAASWRMVQIVRVWYRVPLGQYR